MAILASDLAQLWCIYKHFVWIVWEGIYPRINGTFEFDMDFFDFVFDQPGKFQLHCSFDNFACDFKSRLEDELGSLGIVRKMFAVVRETKEGF